MINVLTYLLIKYQNLDFNLRVNLYIIIIICVIIKINKSL